ncbi:MAG: VOC family protein, partial [Mesorhizobium sp.]
MKQVTPFLMFEGKAEEAMTFYCETIPDSSVLDVTRYG